MTSKTFTIRAVIASVLAFGLAFGLSALVNPAGAAESPDEIFQDATGCYTLSPETQWSRFIEAEQGTPIYEWSRSQTRESVNTYKPGTPEIEWEGYTEYKYKKWTAPVPGVKEYKHVKVTPAVEGVKEYEWTRTLKAQKQVFGWEYGKKGWEPAKGWGDVPDSLQPPHYGDVAATGTLPPGTYGLPRSAGSVAYKYLVFAPEYQTSTTEPAGSGWTKTGEWSWAVEPKPEVKTYAWGARYTFSSEWSETGKWRWVSKPVPGYWKFSGWTKEVRTSPWVQIASWTITTTYAKPATEGEWLGWNPDLDTANGWTGNAPELPVVLLGEGTLDPVTWTQTRSQSTESADKPDGRGWEQGDLVEYIGATESYTEYYVSDGLPTRTLDEASWVTYEPEGWTLVDTRNVRTDVDCGITPEADDDVATVYECTVPLDGTDTVTTTTTSWTRSPVWNAQTGKWELGAKVYGKPVVTVTYEDNEGCEIPDEGTPPEAPVKSAPPAKSAKGEPVYTG